MDAVRRVQFDLGMVSAYSARKQTPAGLWEMKGEGVIEEHLKGERLQALNNLILEVTNERNSRASLGRSAVMGGTSFLLWV